MQGQTGPVDATLYTSYFFDSSYQNFTWVVCGSTVATEGCYASGQLGPFGTVGAMMEGVSSGNRKAGTVTRDIYVVDVASGSAGNDVVLYVYKKMDTINALSDTVKVSLYKSVTLPLTGGSNAVCSMAANAGYLFIGTDQTPEAVRVQKSNLSLETVGGFSPPMNVTSITADAYGYVTVTFGGFLSGENGLIQFGPDGQFEGDGGGAWFMLNTATALSTAGLPQSSSQPALQLGYRFKGRSTQTDFGR
ncbi:MAG: hypothetical protein WB566_05085 [Terriglobales bacterium]